MRAFRALSAVSVAALFVLVGSACSSSDSSAPGGGDTGHTDSASGDGIVQDSGGGTDSTPHDTAKTDSGTVKDTSGDTPSTCVSHHKDDECDMVAQDCSDPTQTCEYDPAVGHSTCGSRALGTGTKGDACKAPTDCDAGLFCYENHCTPACCTGDNSVCGSTKGGIAGACNLDITSSADAGDIVIYQVCTYATTCHPFSCECDSGSICLFDTAPDSFTCDPPAKPAALSAKPGDPCTYENDCGEGQGCFSTGGGPSKCLLFCNLGASDAGAISPCSAPKFAANGTCTVGGTSYGTCTDASSAGIGGGLGLCQ